jgi:hypothetical protein
MQEMKWILKLAAAVTLLLMMNVSVTWGQSSRANLGGRVMDAQGASVPNATIAVIGDDTGVTQTTKTNESGN